MIQFYVPDIDGKIIIRQIKASPQPAASVGFGHFYQPIGRIGLDEGSGFGKYAQGFFEMAWIMVGHIHGIADISGFRDFQPHPRHQKLVDIKGFLSNGRHSAFNITGRSLLISWVLLPGRTPMIGFLF